MWEQFVGSRCPTRNHEKNLKNWDENVLKFGVNWNEMAFLMMKHHLIDFWMPMNPPAGLKSSCWDFLETGIDWTWYLCTNIIFGYSWEVSESIGMIGIHETDLSQRHYDWEMRKITIDNDNNLSRAIRYWRATRQNRKPWVFWASLTPKGSALRLFSTSRLRFGLKAPG